MKKVLTTVLLAGLLTMPAFAGVKKHKGFPGSLSVGRLAVGVAADAVAVPYTVAKDGGKVGWYVVKGAAKGTAGVSKQLFHAFVK